MWANNHYHSDIWSNERLEQGAISELLKHGGNKGDVDLLRQQFKKADEGDKPDQSEIPEA